MDDFSLTLTATPTVDELLKIDTHGIVFLLEGGLIVSLKNLSPCCSEEIMQVTSRPVTFGCSFCGTPVIEAVSYLAYETKERPKETYGLQFNSDGWMQGLGEEKIIERLQKVFADTNPVFDSYALALDHYLLFQALLQDFTTDDFSWWEAVKEKYTGSFETVMGRLVRAAE